MKRPFGITVLAIIFGAAGISYMMLGFQLTTAVTFGPLFASGGTATINSPAGRAPGSTAG